MPLTNALNMTVLGMMTTDTKVSVSAQNITNADKVGYSRKTLDTRYITTNAGAAPISGMIVGSIDRFLSASLVGDIGLSTYRTTIADSLDYYSGQLGSTEGATTMSSYLNDMYSALQYLATNPETNANRSEVISVATNLANEMRNLSGDVQNLRTQAEQKINETVTTINALLDKLDELNTKVTNGQTSDGSIAEYEDQRMQALRDLGTEIDIQYFFTSNNRVQVYLESGMPLLTSIPHHIDYTTTSFINGTILYPAGFDTLDLDGIDITTDLRSGRLAALVNLRDSVYVQEQEKLDEFANVLKDQVNTILNTGASIPPRNPMEGTLQGLTPATAFAATGIVRVAVTDENGIVQSLADINLVPMATINDVLVALNGVAGITATLNADGELSISVLPATSGVTFNEMTSDVTATSQGFSMYFGLNDMFTGTGAETIDITSYLQSGNDYLPVGILSASATLAVGDRGVARGDGSVADALSDQLSVNVSFAAAGNFGAQANTLKRYVEAIMADAATQAKISQTEADTAFLTYNQTKTVLDSKTGVNIDEETAKMVVLENHYAASAKMIQTIQKMMQDLLDAII
jgi:flagellar hook-associated protein 1 FlgK